MRRFSRTRPARSLALTAFLLAVAAVVCGCQTAGFYGQAVMGQYRILVNEERIDRLVADPHTPAALKEQLELVQKLRAFAKMALKLPVDGHYQRYADLAPALRRVERAGRSGVLTPAEDVVVSNRRQP